MSLSKKHLISTFSLTGVSSSPVMPRFKQDINILGADEPNKSETVAGSVDVYSF
jgi:hypothetical protein